MCAHVLVDVCDVQSLTLVLSNPVNTQRDSFAEDTWHMRRRDELDKVHLEAWKKEKKRFSSVHHGNFCVCFSDYSVSRPYWGSFTVDWWVRNAVYPGWSEERGEGSGCKRGKGGEKRQSSSVPTMIYLSVPHPLSPPLLPGLLAYSLQSTLN